MAKIEGWKVLLGILGVIQIVQIVGNYVNSVENSQGTGTALVLLGVIVVLLFRKYDVRSPPRAKK